MVGISIIAAGTAAEALAIAGADPGVQAGRLRVEVHPAFLPSLKELKINYSSEANLVAAGAGVSPAAKAA